MCLKSSSQLLPAVFAGVLKEHPERLHTVYSLNTFVCESVGSMLRTRSLLFPIVFLVYRSPPSPLVHVLSRRAKNRHTLQSPRETTRHRGVHVSLLLSVVFLVWKTCVQRAKWHSHLLFVVGFVCPPKAVGSLPILSIFAPMGPARAGGLYMDSRWTAFSAVGFSEAQIHEFCWDLER